MRLELYLTPIDAPIAVTELTETKTVAQVLREVAADDWFQAPSCRVLLDGVLVAPDTWDCTVLEPGENRRVTFIAVPQGKKTLAILATVAVVALTGFIGAGGIATVFGLGAGSTFAAGGLGASLAASAIGLAGSLGVSALTAPPRSGNDTEQRTSSDAGVSGNTLNLLDVLPVVFGKIGFSPPLLAPPYTTLDGDELTVHMVIGLQGRCLIENIRINDVEAANIAGLQLETSEHTQADTVFAAYPKTVIEERSGQQLTSFKTELETANNDLLTDQVTPDNSAPDWHYWQTAGAWDEVVLRFNFPAGLVDTSNNTAALMPARIEIRKVGDLAWRALPTVHFADYRAGAGSMRTEVRLNRMKQPSGRHFSSADGEYAISDLTNIAADGQTFAQSSDPYFVNDAYNQFAMLPTMAAPTTSGVTITASSEFSAIFAAWKIGDGTSSPWRPLANSLPAWVKIQFPTAKTVKSYYILNYAPALGTTDPASPANWYLEGSNNDVAWTEIDRVDVSNDPLNHSTYQVENPDSYIYYRWTFTGNFGAANGDVRIQHLYPSENDAPGISLTSETSTGTGILAQRTNNANKPRCFYGSLGLNGATFYLDPAVWPAGTYDIRVKRGVALRESYFSAPAYTYNGSAANADYFEYRSVSGKYKIFIGQKSIRSDCVIEAFQTIDNTPPFSQGGLTAIALSAPNIQISSVYGEFTRYAPVWTGTEWTEIEMPTKNPAALYRQLLLGGANLWPIDGDVIDEDSLQAWFTRCAANGYEANAVMQGGRVGEALQMLAAAGYAAPRSAETYGVIEDYDTSAVPASYAITPLNSQDQGSTQTLIDVPDFIRAEFNDAALKYAVNHLIVYRDGMDASTAKRGQTVTYTGWTDAAKVTARAAFDLKQAVARQVRYRFRMGIEGFMLRRGDVVQVINDVIDRAVATGRIASVTVSAGNVTAIMLDNVMPFSMSADIASVADVEALADVENPGQAFGVFIQIPGSAGLIKQVSEVSDSNTCTFAMPFVDDGSVVPGLIVGAGPMGRIGRRCKVMSIQPEGFETRIVELADEATELFAA
jgi:hypothetical protein